MREYLGRDENIWYTTPIKALSNDKYREFKREFSGYTIGLATGDRSENVNSPLVVATTEVLRNHLVERGTSPSFVVLDEAHFMMDSERGTIWEEVIILSSLTTRLLLLSATISNASEVAKWIESVRGVPCYVVEERKRPVPVKHAFMSSRGSLVPLFDGGKLYEDVTKSISASCSTDKAVREVNKYKLTPCLVFVNSRKKTEELAKYKDKRQRGKCEKERTYSELLYGEFPISE